MNKEECLHALKGAMELMLFDPMFGEEKTPEMLNDMDRGTYDALEYAIGYMEGREDPPLEEVRTCAGCRHNHYDLAYAVGVCQNPKAPGWDEIVEENYRAERACNMYERRKGK